MALTMIVAACDRPPPVDWSLVVPGMRSTELVAVAGPPQQHLSNHSLEAWQYCADSFRYAADSHTIVWLDNGQVVSVEHHPNISGAYCEDLVDTLRWTDAPKRFWKRPQYNGISDYGALAPALRSSKD
jgi:hypothetical protein